MACCGKSEADLVAVRSAPNVGGDTAIDMSGVPLEHNAASTSVLEVPERLPFELMEDAPPKRIETLDDSELSSLKRLRSAVKFMDNGATVPVINYKFGADAVMGMVPYAGDVTGALIGTWIVSKALRYHLPRRVVVRMAVHQAIDTCGGVFPVIGDMFDYGYKANAKNLQLVEAHLQKPGKAKRADACFLFTMFFVVVVVPLLLVFGILAGIIVGILAAFGVIR